MVNQPETPEKGPLSQPEKLVLPALHEEYTPAQPGASPHLTMPIPPEYLINRQSVPPPQDLQARLRYFWRKDPANKVLLIAVVMVLIAGTVFVSLISNTLLHNSNFFAANSTFPQTPVTAVTANVRPTFAPPGGGKGSKTSSLPPAHSTPSLQPTPSSPSNPTPGAGTLTVQITSLPTDVRNYQSVTVGVTTSEPNVTVYLYVVYNVPPHRGFAGPATSDGNGNATLNWLVTVYARANGGARASVVAIAKDQNGQQAQSQPVAVHIGD